MLSVSNVAEALPVSVQQVKHHLRIDHSDEDAGVEGYLQAAIDHVERTTGRLLRVATVTQTFDGFPNGRDWSGDNRIHHDRYLQLDRSPVISVTSVKYLLNDVLTLIDSAEYRFDAVREPARLEPAVGFTWPVPDLVDGSVQVIYQAGYATGAVPKAIKQAILLYVGAMYRDRESTTGERRDALPMGVDDLLNPYRLHLVT